MSKFPLANKNLGQHFLSSPSVIQKITENYPADFDAIIEVGPGPGVLTSHLAKLSRPLFVIEKDQRFVEVLSQHVPASHLFLTDALHFDWKDFFNKHPYKKVWLVSNLPYNISVPLTLAFFQEPALIRLTLMYQKEVALKFFPTDPKNAMSSLYALGQSFFQVKKVVDAPPGAFVPPPKVHSQVLSFHRKEQSVVPLEQWDKFETFLRLIFAQKRKQLVSLIKGHYPPEKILGCLEEMNISLSIRAEALQFEELVKLYSDLT